VGVISTHTYDLHNNLLNWYPKGLEEYYQATRDRTQESWMTEWEVVTNGEFKATNEWDILRENIRHFNRDLSTLQFNAWVYWQTWHAKDRPTSIRRDRLPTERRRSTATQAIMRFANMAKRARRLEVLLCVRSRPQTLTLKEQASKTGIKIFRALSTRIKWSWLFVILRVR
jgi:hypothetical protein